MTGLPATALVLGSNSFSGASFAAHLLRAGVRVIGASRSPEPREAFLPYRWGGLGEGFRFVQADLNHDLDALMDVIAHERPAWVVNFAAQSMVAESWRHPEHWFRTNVVATIALHERLRHCDFLERYVHITTPEVYGSTAGLVDEDAPFNPSTPYAVSRAAADMSLRTFHTAYGFPVVYTRAANVYGPGQQLYRLVPRAMLSGRLGRRLPLHGGGWSERSFIHIDDVCEATLLIARDGRPGQAYHISTERMVAIRDLVALIATRMGLAFEQLAEPVGERLGKDAAYRLDSAKLRDELGWRDRIGLEQGLDSVLTWVDAHLDELRTLPLDYVHKA
ncbi:MAG: GDP-mannose 4,6-dehydratase [Rhodocyclales bacterium]|nr:GDP-mannose 4,6-dehydratase [Rhodocyclales bacterium]